MNDEVDSIHILHVDDDPEVASLTASMLHREDGRFSVSTAQSTSGARRYLTDHDVDCVVSDYDMPETNGIDLLRTVRADDEELPFILFTGKGSEEIASTAISAGVTDYLQKGTGSQQYTILANRIRNAVERTQAKRDRDRHLEAIETAQEGISILDDDGRFVYVNDAYANLYGYEPNELIGEHWDILYRDEDVATIDEDILPTVEETGTWSGRTTGLRADGTTFPEAHRLAKTEAGELICTVREAKRYGQADARRELLDRALNALDDVLYVLGPAGEILWCTDRLPTETGFAADEVVEMAAVDFFPENQQAHIERAIEETIEDGRTVVEAVLETAAGERVSHEFTGTRITDDANSPVGIVGVGREITQQKERERKLAALNETAQKLMTADSRDTVAEIGAEAAHDVLGLEANGVHLWDDDASGLVPVAQSETGEALVPEQPTFEPGDGIAWDVYETNEPRVIDSMHEGLDPLNPDTDIQSEVFLPIEDFGILIASSTNENAFDEDDLVLGELLVNGMRAALENAARTEELRDREQDLREQNERLNEFTAVVSHDLRNPLHIATGNVELALDDHPSEQLEKAKDALERMDRLIEDLLTLAQEGDAIGETEPVDITEVATEAWTGMPSTEASLKTLDEMTITADRGRLRQLIENLMRNAVEHGGSDVTVTVGPLEDGFYFEDDGRGIPPDQREAVFEEGYSTAGDDTGLGLRIVSRVAQAHGWSIDLVEGSEGGARFEFRN